MRFFALKCNVNAKPETVWLEQVNSKGFHSRPEAEAWPRTAVKETVSLLYRRRIHQRTVAPLSGGTQIQDHVQYEARFQILSPWLKASGIMSLRREHDTLRVQYGAKATSFENSH